MVTEPGPTWYWSSQADWGVWGGDHGQPMCWNSGGPGPNWYSDPVWAKGVIEIPDEWKCDQTFIEFVWKADCMNQYEGAYIDDVVISRVINQGEKVYSAHEQVTLVPGEQKFMRFSPPWGECCPPEHGKYWIEVRVKTHSNFVADENPADDWLKDEIIVKCHHDVGVTEVIADPFYQEAGDVFSYLIPTNVSFTVKNFCAYDDEFDVKMTVHNMEYDTSFSDDVESGNRGWEHGAFDGPDLWHISTRDANSPTHSWACMESDVGLYDNGMWNYLISPTLNFAGLKDAYTCFNAKWALAEGDEWWWFIFDPYSNFIIRFGPQFTGCSGEWLPDYNGHPIWIGQKNPAGVGPFVGGGENAPDYPYEYGYHLRHHYMCMPILNIIKYLNDIGFSWLGVEMFGPRGDPEFRAGFGFAVITDGSGREALNNEEKWSGLFIDDVAVFTVEAGETVYEETWTVLLPAQGGEQTIHTKYCWPGIWGDFEIDIETLLETDCNPDNNWMDAYNHIYYSYWFDDMEEYTYYDETPFQGDWTTADLTVEDMPLHFPKDTGSNWHIVHNQDPVAGLQDYWWCGIEDDTFYGPDWDDCLTSPIFDLYSLIPRSPWMASAVTLAFRMCYHLDIGDAFFIEVSNDSGRNWYTIEEWYGPEQSDCWHDYEILIPQKYYTETFMFRFRFYSDGVWENKGVLLDDIILQAMKGKNETITVDEFPEDFGAPPTWPPECIAEIIDYSQSGATWESSTEAIHAPPGSTGIFAIADSDAAGSGTLMQTGMVTCEIDLEPYAGETITLEFDHNFDPISTTEIGQVIVDGNVEAQYDTVDSIGHESIDISAYGGNVVQIEFYYDDANVWSWEWAIDNIEVIADGTPVYEQNFGGDFAWPPAGWTLVDYDADGVSWDPYLAPNSYFPNADFDGYFPGCNAYDHIGTDWDDGLLSPLYDLSMYDSAKASFDYFFDFWSSGDIGQVLVWVDGTLVDVPYTFTADSSGNGEFSLPTEANVQVEFYYGSISTFPEQFGIDNFMITATMPPVITGMGDALAWFFEDDAETGGNPLWTPQPTPGGDLWRPFCYPVVTQPVYSTFGELVIPPVQQACPDDGYLQVAEPDLFPPPSGDHFWMAEKLHYDSYDAGTETVPGGQYSYLNDMDNILISPEIDLTGCYHGHISFWLAGQLEYGDQLWFMIREKNEDGSWGVWNYIEGDTIRYGEPYYHIVHPNPLGFLSLTEDLYGWEYDGIGWAHVNTVEDYQVEPWWGLELDDRVHPYFVIDLMGYIPPLADNNPVIQIGFRLMTDGAGVDAGVKIDDVLLSVKRDITAPATTCDISGTMGCNDWYTSGVTVRLMASDDLVGAKETYYRIDGGAWQLYDDRFQVTVDGEHTVEYYSVDRVGNVEEIQTCESFKIDQTAPTVGLSMPETGYLYVMGRPIFQIGRTIVIGDLSSQASASDATSGIDYVEFIVDGEVKSADLSAPFTFDLPKGGLIPSSHTLQVKAYDNACNAATSTQLTYLKWF
jgi:hypothetical protein